MKHLSIATIAAILAITLQLSHASDFTAANAEDGIFKAFQTHQLVGIRDAHGWAQEEDFYSAVLRDPRFAREVGNVVLETGDAAHQNVVDRYVNGENWNVVRNEIAVLR